MAKGSSIADRTAYMLLAMLTGGQCVWRWVIVFVCGVG
jgi:hypothetical protein